VNQVTVRCTIENCYYWARGNVCDAREILVTHDDVGARYPESMDAQQLSTILDQVGESSASGCLETCCKTFRSKS
jgi:hypothetical protein